MMVPWCLIFKKNLSKGDRFIMHLVLVKYTCSKCSTQFKAPELPNGIYGDFLLRSGIAGDMRFLAAIDDGTYDEVDTLMLEIAAVANQNVHKRADILREIYGQVACDPDRNGNFFKIGLDPACPSCGSQSGADWRFTEPPEFVNQDVPPVTHRRWNGMSADAKRAAVLESVAQF